MISPPSTLRYFTLRRCPVCAAIRVDGDTLSQREFWMCEGPHMGPFPTDRSHKMAPTEPVVVQEVPLPKPPDYEMCHIHRERSAATVLDTGEPVCAECWREHVTGA